MQKTLFYFLIFISLNVFSQSNNYISFNQRIDVLENHKKVKNNVSIYYDQSKNTITKHITHPTEIITTTNAVGEVKIYYPTSNKVHFKQIGALSSKHDQIYYFANNLTDHLGLADEGFTLSKREFEDKYLVTWWKAPSIMKIIDQVKMVYENGVPIYAEYLNSNQKITKKIYYRNYQDHYNFRMPSKIVEIIYNAQGDSTINRTVFSNVKVENTPFSDYFNFKIPADAKPIQDK